MWRNPRQHLQLCRFHSYMNIILWVGLFVCFNVNILKTEPILLLFSSFPIATICLVFQTLQPWLIVCSSGFKLYSSHGFTCWWFLEVRLSFHLTELSLYPGFRFLIAEWPWHPFPHVFVIWSRLSTAAQTIFLKQYLPDFIYSKMHLSFSHIFTSHKSIFILCISGVSWCHWQCISFLAEHTILEQPTADILDSIKCSTLCHLWGVVRLDVFFR